MADVDIATVTGPMADYVQDGPGKQRRELLEDEQAQGNNFKLLLDRPSLSPTVVDELDLELCTLQCSHVQQSCEVRRQRGPPSRWSAE